MRSPRPRSTTSSPRIQGSRSAGPAARTVGSLGTAPSGSPGDGRGGWRPWTRIGAGWHVMSAVVSPGDVTGDQRADVLAVEGATGYLWLYPGNGAGGWLPRTRAGEGWNSVDPVP